MTLPQPDLTGAAKMALAFALEFVRREYSVVLLHGAVRSGHESILDEFRFGGVALVSNPAFGPAISPIVFQWLLRELKRTNPVAAVSMFVTTDAKYVGPACRILGIPHVSAVQNDLVFYGNPVTRRLKAALFGTIYRCTVDLAVCTSEKMRLSLAREHGMPKNRLAVLPNGVETKRVSKLSLLKRCATRKELRVAEDEVLLANVGRLHPQKGQDVVIEAVSRLSGQFKARIKLFLIGDADPGKNEAARFVDGLRDEISRHGLGHTVQLLGWRNDIPALLHAADVYVHSARYEGWPLAVLEAMAAGLPVIYSDCAGSIQGFEDAKHGYCFQSGRADQLSQCLASLLVARPEQLRGMGKNCQELVDERYEISTISKRFADLVLSTASQPQKLI